jgi:hypothetical protein
MNRSAFAIATATALALGSFASAAESETANPRPAQLNAGAPVVLASVTTSQVPSAQNAAEGTAPIKKVRAARVTTCRCGEGAKGGEANPR